MVKYLTLSFAVNLLLFTVYSYWVGKALENAFREIKEYLPPLVVSVKVEEVKPQAQEEEKSAPVSAQTAPKSGGKRETKVKPRKPSLLSELMPAVEKEYRSVFRKIISKAEASLSKSGKVKISLNRKVVYIPPVKPLKVEYPPAPAEVKITVLPDGRVINAVLIKRSGNPKVDRAILNFARNLRFAPIEEPIVQEIYIDFRFKF